MEDDGEDDGEDNMGEATFDGIFFWRGTETKLKIPVHVQEKLTKNIVEDVIPKGQDEFILIFQDETPPFIVKPFSWW